MEQVIYRLSEISKLYAGGDAPKEVSSERTDEYCYPIYSNGLENEGLYGFCKKATMKSNTLTISARGTIGATFYRKEPFLPIVRLITIEPDNKKIYSWYLYYYLQMNKLEGYGTSQQQLTLPFMKKKKFLIYKDVSYQQQIATILNNYDQLIENNNKRIKILEDMAESIYKEWFVRFRFPGYEGVKFKDSELGKIPTTFDIVKINEVLDYYVGGGWGNDDYSEDFPIEAYVIRGADFPFASVSNISSCPKRYHKSSNYGPRKLGVNDIVFEISGGTAEQPVGRSILVTKGILDQLDNKVICASFCKLIRANYKKITANYFYQWLQFLYNTRIIEKYQLQSTGIINFKFEYFLRKGPVLLPSMDLMLKFEKQIKPIREEIDKLAMQNSYLIKQCDSLLPRLMSGKLSVEGKEVTQNA